MALNVTLVVVGGDVKTPEVKLRLPSTVGRGRDCSIMLRHPLVSRQHCEIFESGGTLLVRDLGSLNGTFVNNQRIEGDAQLQPGQLLTIGTVTFRAMYELGDAAESPPDTPAPQMKVSAKPSSETNADGTLAAPRPTRGASETVRNVPPNVTPPTEPVDADEDFDLDDAKPLFAEMDDEKTSEDISKNGGSKTVSSAETVFSPTKKPAPPPPPAPAAMPAPAAAKPAPPPPPKPVAPPPKPAEDKAAKNAPPAKADAPAFDFLENEDASGDDGDDDDLNDFLKNLK